MEDYLSDRLEDQINWYDKKSISCQKKYNLNKYIQIIAGALIPAITPFSLAFNSLSFTIVISVLGIFIVISQSISNTKKFHENYIQYRTTCEVLKHEKYLFINNVEPYDNETEPIKLLVLRVESIISNENINWQTMRQDVKEEEKC
ncbi:DUF4231 domain-containing protein [Staphylococcus epidermidis]|uniref:DUF4231 domain-containing protein n=1 Tax=Staphylococcus epidermidis TaxID=1282 RepID=A0AAE5V5U8_STAEP|nr:DUF4231 domain-containing protein [Staphylococcus epidermidis]PIH08369.1 hypothetical protein CTJ00_00250 [Staphylococcus epidermidis]PIH09123.1 hypothetical protein CTJ08_12735 [Staphylococcus epidermidis]TES37207.1 DUF4231 domain-containing protein [Staphylococcus epidermidis]